MKPYAILLAAGLLAACTSNAGYGPASKSGAMGYSSQQIETGRYQVSYTDSSPSKARDRALLRAAELTLLEGSDWFEITSSFAERSEDSRSGGSSVSIGGSSGSRGHSSVGVGVGIGIPLGGGNSGSVTEVLEIITGKGDKPDRPSVYDARSVDINLRGSATE
ncbi:hypothetical protein [Hyphomonas sp.]|uniref:CC0125/CC1285 family lipoprotein n=1 Tax=Hyphomonas sp. TaxID=87 RepID=UPI000DFF45B0|nr:hypothetical protein [Hyphomonas sp.]RCL86111.1 MAG: hypothetical protein DBW63_11065 [Hyphomonas sp.]